MVRLLIIFLGIPIFSFSQVIRVVNEYTQEKIEGVIVEYPGTNKKWITNKKGEIVTALKKRKVVLKHKNYFTRKILLSGVDEEILLEPKHEDLECVVLSVSRVAEKINKIPEQIKIVTKKNIEYISPQTSADLLANIAGVRVQKSQLGGGSPVIRGMESNRVLLVVDGVRMNNAIYRNGHLQNSITVSPLAIDRAEVVFGPASVSYGSDALGGVIHYYTKKLNYSNTFSNKNNVFYRHSTVNNEQTVAFSSYNNHKKWASFTNVSFSKFSDLRIGKNRKHGYKDWGKVFNYSKNTEDVYYENSSVNSNTNILKNTGYRQLDILQKFKFPINNKIDLVLNGQLSNSSNIPNFGKLNDLSNNGDLKFSEWYYGPQQRLLISAQAQFNDYKSVFQNGTITLAYQDIKESRINRRFKSLDRFSRFENVKVFSLNSDFYKSLTKAGNRKLFYGLELVHNTVGSKSEGQRLSVLGNKVIGFTDVFDIDTRYPSKGSTYSSAAIYGAYRQHLNKKNTLNLGLRLTNTFLTANWNPNIGLSIPNNAIKVNNKELTGSIGYIYRPGDSDRINVVISKGFRSPNVDDIGKIRAKSGKLTVPNTQLKPEHLYSFEAGYSRVTKNQKAKFNINIYYTMLSGYIERSPSSEFGSEILYDGDVFKGDAILANINQGEATIYGASVGGALELSKYIKSRMDVTYTKGKAYDNNQPLSSIPPLFGNFYLGLYQSKYDVALAYKISLAKELKDYNQVEGIDNLDETPNGKGTPSWEVLNLNANYHLKDDLKLQFQIQNIFDRHYKEFASSISAPGRNFVASLAYSF